MRTYVRPYVCYYVRMLLVLLGGTRMKYPSRAIVVLESLLNSDNMDTPAPSTAKPKESRISEPDGPAL